MMYPAHDGGQFEASENHAQRVRIGRAKARNQERIGNFSLESTVSSAGPGDAKSQSFTNKTTQPRRLYE